MSTRSLGDIALAIGSYEKDGQTRHKSRKIGELLETTDERGSRLWLKLDAEQLSPSLLIVAGRNGLIRKGEDTVSLNVYPPREKTAGKSSEQQGDEREPF